MHRPFRKLCPVRLRRVARLPAALGVVAVCGAAVAIAACGGEMSTPPSNAGQSPTSNSQAPTASALVAYRDMWAGLVTAAETSDFQSPLLAQHATGTALTLLVQGLARDQLHDIVTRGITQHHPVVTSLSPAAAPNRATVNDCFDDSQWIEYTTAGKRAKNAPGDDGRPPRTWPRWAAPGRSASSPWRPSAPADHGARRHGGRGTL